MPEEPYNPSPIGNPSCWCQRYEEHLHYMRKTALQFLERVNETSNIPFPPDAKERIKQRLADQIW